MARVGDLRNTKGKAPRRDPPADEDNGDNVKQARKHHQDKGPAQGDLCLGEVDFRGGDKQPEAASKEEGGDDQKGARDMTRYTGLCAQAEKHCNGLWAKKWRGSRAAVSCAAAPQAMKAQLGTVAHTHPQGGRDGAKYHAREASLPVPAALVASVFTVEDVLLANYEGSVTVGEVSTI